MYSRQNMPAVPLASSKTFSLSRIGRTLVKIRQTRLMLSSAAMDEGERELRIISSVSYSFFIFFSIIENHII